MYTIRDGGIFLFGRDGGVKNEKRKFCVAERNDRSGSNAHVPGSQWTAGAIPMCIISYICMRYMACIVGPAEDLSLRPVNGCYLV